MRHVIILGLVIVGATAVPLACTGDDDCTPNCAGRECGWDPVCGTLYCGDCPSGQTCTPGGTCSTTGPTCPADRDCTGRVCGPDPVCMTSCGTCPSGETCTMAGRCTCNPATCAGCCDGAGNCVDGSYDEACGIAGSTCDTCGIGEICLFGFCDIGGPCGSGADCTYDAACADGWCEYAWGLTYRVVAVEGRYYSLPSDPDGSYPDPYVEMLINGSRCTTSYVSNTSRPTWNQGCDFEIDTGSTFAFTVYDDDVTTDDVIARLSATTISLSWLHDGELTATGTDGSWTRFRFQASSSCLPAASMVRLADGTMKPIQAIVPGDEVVGYDASSNQPVPAVVERVLIHDAGPFVTSLLMLDNSRSLEATPNHPILTGDGVWKTVADIVPGDTVYLYDPGSATLRAALVASIIREYSEQGTVYNLKTTASSYVAEDIVVHNKCLRGGSLVDTPTGPRAVETIRVGDTVFGSVDGVRAPTTVRRIFVKTTILSSLPGRQLTEHLAVTDNHPVWDGTTWRSASETSAPPQRIPGAVYDLATDAGNYYADGVLLQAAE